MTRREDWPARLAAAVEAARFTPFAWGFHDCAHFAANVVQAMTGVDYVADYRGRYTSAAGAARVMKKGGGLEALTTAELGEPCEAMQARRGDVVGITSARGASLGICLGAQCAFADENGLSFVDLQECTQAWHV